MAGSIPVAHSERWWRNWQPRTPQERVSSDVRVRLPSGARMESEPARVLGLAANECAPAGVGFDCSALRRMDDEAAGRQPPPRKRVGEETRWGSGPPSSDMGNYPTGEGDRLIRGYARFDSWVAYHHAGRARLDGHRAFTPD